MLLFGSHATAFAPPSAPPSRAAEKAPAAEKASDGRGWLGSHVELGFTQVGLVTTDSFCETVRAGFVANEQEISETFGEWFTNCAKKAITEALKENGVLTKANFGEALKENGVLTKANFGKALVEIKVLTETQLQVHPAGRARAEPALQTGD